MRKLVVRAKLKGPFRRGGILAIRPTLEADIFGLYQKLFSTHLLRTVDSFKRYFVGYSPLSWVTGSGLTREPVDEGTVMSRKVVCVQYIKHDVQSPHQRILYPVSLCNWLTINAAVIGNFYNSVVIL